MVYGIDLEHLQEHEVQIILAVLERDAKIQKKDEARRRKLQNSIREERIPQKRLSIKCRTGEWMREVTEPSRVAKKRGVEVVRASIKVKRSSKPQRTTRFTVLENEGGDPGNDSSYKSSGEDHGDQKAKPDQYDESAGKYQDTYEESVTADPDAKPVRKTSFRRKKTSPNHDKQVKFATEKTEKYVYEPTKVESPEIVIEEPPTNVPTIVIDDPVDEVNQEEGYDKPAAETTERKGPQYAEQAEPDDAVSYDSGVYSSGTTFESYHNAVGKELHKEEKSEKDYAAGVPKSEKHEDTSSPKGMKKIRVVKRKGSTRRKSPKITDDSTRNTFFSPESEEGEGKTKESAEKHMSDTVPPVVAVATVILGTDTDKCEPELPAEPATTTEPYAPTTEPTYSTPKAPSEPVPDMTEQDYTVAPTYPETNSKPDAVSKEIESMYDEASKETEKSLLDEVVEAVISMPQPNGYKNPDQSYAATTEKAAPADESKYKEKANEVSHPTPLAEYGTGEVTTEQIKTEETPKESKKDEYKADIVAQTTRSGYEPMEKEPEQDTAAYSIDTVKEVAEAAISYVADKITKNEPIEIQPSYDEVTKPNEPINQPEPYAPAVVEAAVEEQEKECEKPGTPDICEEDESKGSPTTGKTKKKVVKKVIKKKIPQPVEDENTPPKTEKPAEEEEGREGLARNLSQLQRGKTVRKKVVRKKPPKKTEE